MDHTSGTKQIIKLEIQMITSLESLSRVTNHLGPCLASIPNIMMSRSRQSNDDTNSNMMDGVIVISATKKMIKYLNYKKKNTLDQ